MMKLKAILFDLDGTLIDSEYFHYECWNEILEPYGIQLSYQDWLKNYAGIPLPANAVTLLQKYQIKVPVAEVISKREALTLERLKSKDVNLMPFALEVIRFFYERNLTLAIVTSSPRADVEAIFARNGLSAYFKLILTRTEVKNNKPDPESYHKCCEALNLLKEDCIVFEDTLNGIKAAKAAGLTCFAVQSDVEMHSRLDLADRIFLNLMEAKEEIVNRGLLV